MFENFFSFLSSKKLNEYKILYPDILERENCYISLKRYILTPQSLIFSQLSFFSGISTTLKNLSESCFWLQKAVSFFSKLKPYILHYGKRVGLLACMFIRHGQIPAAVCWLDRNHKESSFLRTQQNGFINLITERYTVR